MEIRKDALLGKAEDPSRPCVDNEGKSTDAVLAGKGYDASYAVEKITEMNAEQVVPPKLNHKQSRTYDKCFV